MALSLLEMLGLSRAREAGAASPSEDIVKLRLTAVADAQDVEATTGSSPVLLGQIDGLGVNLTGPRCVMTNVLALNSYLTGKRTE